eukprot:scaffold108243_cov51-Attheya_sp.AAC.1
MVTSYIPATQAISTSQDSLLQPENVTYFQNSHLDPCSLSGYCAITIAMSIFENAKSTSSTKAMKF